MVVQADAGVIGGRQLPDERIKLCFRTAGLAQVQTVEAVAEESGQRFGFIGQEIRGGEDD